MPADDGLEPLPASLARTWGNTETTEERNETLDVRSGDALRAQDVAADRDPRSVASSEGQIVSREETLEDRVTRLLGEAHALAQNGDIEDALDLASVAYADWYEDGSDV